MPGHLIEKNGVEFLPSIVQKLVLESSDSHIFHSYFKQYNRYSLTCVGIGIDNITHIYVYVYIHIIPTGKVVLFGWYMHIFTPIYVCTYLYC